MSYSIQQFITQASAGGGVSLSAATVTLNCMIDYQQPFSIGTTSIDVGQYFSSRQVLECYALRAAIISGDVIASAGVVSLSM